MGQLILHKDGAYQVYITTIDAPMFGHAITLDELREYIRGEYGEAGLRELPERLERAHKTGCSSRVLPCLEACIRFNLAGPGETRMGVDEFISEFLTLPKP